ncbi:GIY-YIG nuclease family protein [Roseinatronobacter sp. S2]|uniref:GIY-YIG nuclease family protein n=1 Tax=Roseinatronobacter sp. S2 TaxID=3035471 RepID=UPI00240F680A|nr:GIY-YIG nuclease family protein [Roseinatronobacter sp. S2]WFE75665.1 hypothetical protein P8S53_04430 [Roseinatronobacter sp. S2]
MTDQISGFSIQTMSQLGQYVYALIDPRRQDDPQGGIFYIGKGTGQRCFHHAALVAKSGVFSLSERGADLKSDTIKEILQLGQKPEIKVVAYGLDDARAFALETILISVLNLSNKHSGHNSNQYWRNVNELEEQHGQPVMRSEIPGTVLLVGMNNSYPDAKADPASLAEQTLGDWTIAPVAAKRVDLIIGLHQGLMVSFFRTKKDSEGNAIFRITNEATREKHKKRRCRFEGEPAPELAIKWERRSLHDDNSETGTVILSTLGRQQSLRYLPET